MSRRQRKSAAPSVDLREVERLAGLARLSLGPKEAEKLRDEFSTILEYFATLDKVDVSTVSLSAEVDLGGGTREDSVRPSTPEEILKGVPQKKGRLVRAPRVF